MANKVFNTFQEHRNLNSTNPQQQALVNTVRSDLEHLNLYLLESHLFLRMRQEMSVFVFYPVFRRSGIEWLCKYNPLLLILNSYLKLYRDQTNQAIMTNTILTVALLGSFAAFFITSYLITYRRTLKSISKLKNGIGVIGSGNLDYILMQEER